MAGFYWVLNELDPHQLFYSNFIPYFPCINLHLQRNGINRNRTLQCFNLGFSTLRWWKRALQQSCFSLSVSHSINHMRCSAPYINQALGQMTCSVVDWPNVWYFQLKMGLLQHNHKSRVSVCVCKSRVRVCVCVCVCVKKEREGLIYYKVLAHTVLKAEMPPQLHLNSILNPKVWAQKPVA
jgi:hypothetical protein